MAQQVFRVGDKVDFGTTNQSVGTVLETSSLAGYGKQIVRLDLSWAASYWYPADLLHLVPPRRVYYVEPLSLDGTLVAREGAVRGKGAFLLYAYAGTNLLTDTQRRAGLRAGMAAMGYEEAE